MRLYLSAVFENSGLMKTSKDITDIIDISKVHILQSFVYAKEEHAERYKDCKSFMMDSGAFTLMMSKKNVKNFNIKKFATNYANFIKKWDVDNFVELDVDGIFGVDVYKDILHLVQDITGKDPVRVFHGWRGRDYFEELVKVKNRICMGGIAMGKARRNSLDYFQWFLDTAHKNNCKVHGLAVTSPELLRKYNFDSCDSSSWTYSARSGTLYRFDGCSIKAYTGSENCPEGKRIDTAFCAEKGVKEWAKYCEYLDKEYSSLYDTIL